MVVTGNDRGVGVIFRAQSAQTFYLYRITTASDCHQLLRFNNGVPTELGRATSSYTKGDWFTIRVIVLGTSIQVLNDETVVFTITDASAGALSSGTIGLWVWFGNGVTFDNVFVHSVALQSSFTSAKAAYATAGVSSLQNIDQSFAAVAQRGAPLGVVPAASDIDGNIVTARTIFSCKKQTRRIAANARSLTSVAIPLAVHGAASPGAYFIMSGGWVWVGVWVQLFSIDPFTAQLAATRAIPFQTKYTLRIGASVAGYDSGWFNMGSQAGTASFRELRHGLAVSPAGLITRVLIRALDGANAGFVFAGSGMACGSEDNAQGNYGGVLFGYSNNIGM